MSAPATEAAHLGPVPVPDTEAQQILQGLAELQKSVQAHADAINNLGANVQWIVDNVQGIFQMFNSPQFASMMPGVLGAAAKGMTPDAAEG